MAVAGRGLAEDISEEEISEGEVSELEEATSDFDK